MNESYIQSPILGPSVTVQTTGEPAPPQVNGWAISNEEKSNLNQHIANAIITGVGGNNENSIRMILPHFNYSQDDLKMLEMTQTFFNEKSMLPLNFTKQYLYENNQ